MGGEGVPNMRQVKTVARSELAAVFDDQLGCGLAAAATFGLHFPDHVHALNHTAEDHVLAVQPEGDQTHACALTSGFGPGEAFKFPPLSDPSIVLPAVQF